MKCLDFLTIHTYVSVSCVDGNVNDNSSPVLAGHAVRSQTLWLHSELGLCTHFCRKINQCMFSVHLIREDPLLSKLQCPVTVSHHHAIFTGRQWNTLGDSETHWETQQEQRAAIKVSYRKWLEQNTNHAYKKKFSLFLTVRMRLTIISYDLQTHALNMNRSKNSSLKKEDSSPFLQGRPAPTSLHPQMNDQRTHISSR